MIQSTRGTTVWTRITHSRRIAGCSMADDADMESAPLVFVHYGDSYYLRYTLEAAVLFNPDKQVVLLGDRHNAHYQSLGVAHVDYERYAEGHEIDVFDRVYQYTAGALHGRQDWTRFVFRRWFIMHNYFRAHDIHRFWTFDSDTLIVTRISGHEHKFAAAGSTEQCSGICMNGYIADVRLVQRYVDKINELFMRQDFMREQHASARELPSYAYTEMNAYIAFRDEAGLAPVRLGSIIDGETFLDSICTVEEHKVYLDDDEYETYDAKVWGHELKKVFLRADGEMFVLHRASRRMVKLNSINMSWAPDWLFDRMLHHAKLKLNQARSRHGLWTTLKRQWAGIAPGDAHALTLLELVQDDDEIGEAEEVKELRPDVVRRLLGRPERQ